MLRAQPKVRRILGGRGTTNDMWVMVRMALAGGGLTFGMEETFRSYIQRGELVPLLLASAANVVGTCRAHSSECMNCSS